MRTARWLAGAAMLASLGACSLAPHYAAPATVAPPTYKEATGWTTATPLDTASRGNWWTVFRDPVLDGLEARIEPASPTLAAALARYDQARGAADVAAGGRLPTVTASGNASRERASGGRPLSTSGAATYNDLSLGLSLNYDLDLWGRIRNTVAAGRADAQASAADLAAVRLSLQSSLADAYVRLRGLDAQAALLQETVQAYTRARDLTATRHDGGIASGLDVNRAETLLSSARAQISDVANQRAATEHEIAALVGEVASNFGIAPRIDRFEPPLMTAGVPSELLQRRPDIAEAERRIFAANARIGVARAAQYPSLTLGLGAGLEASHGSLFTSPASFWALGPLALAQTLFDGGANRAGVRVSRAVFAEASANYRQAVLTAFREVEDGIAASRHQTTQVADQRAAAAAAGRTRELALTRYRDGASDYLEVVTAQTAALEAERATIAIQTLRMQSAVALLRACGGSYEPVPA